MRPFTFARGVVIFLALGGCGGATITSTAYNVPPSGPELFRYAAVGRDFRTEIHGNPSAAPKQVFEAAVIDAMQGNTWGRPTNFTTTPSQTAREDYRVVMIFSGDRSYGGKAACGSVDAASLAPVGGSVKLQAAFCYRDRMLSQSHVAFEPFGAIEGSDLDFAVSQAILQLFPLREPNRGRDRDAVFFVP